MLGKVVLFLFFGLPAVIHRTLFIRTVTTIMAVVSYSYEHDYSLTFMAYSNCNSTGFMIGKVVFPAFFWPAVFYL